MLTQTETDRYLRHILLREVGAQGQQKLLASRVLVVGAGGLGAPIIQYLAAAGVGTLAIADDDRVELSNLQRQVIYQTGDVGRSKVAAAAAAARAINPGIEVMEFHQRLGEDMDAAVGVSSFDLVIEGVDSFEARYAIGRACLGARTPLLSAAIGRFDGQIGLFAPYAGNFPCYRCLVPEPPPREETLTCAEEGVLGPVAGVVGAMAALEAVKYLVGTGPDLRGEILLYDGLRQESRRIRLPRDPACPACGTLTR